MERGIIKWFDEEKGFGFIQADNKEEYFVHRSNLTDQTQLLEKGQSVEFEVGEGKKGPMAVNVAAVYEEQ